MDLRRGIQLAVDHVVENLKKMSTPIKGKAEVSNVATISANGDKQIGDLIATVFDKVGADGTITVADGKTLETEVEYVDGLRWDRGYISPYFITDTKAQKTEYENPLILLVDKKVSQVQQVLHHLEFAMQQNRPLLIVAEDVETEALATLIVNRLRGGLKVCAVKAPGFGDNRKNTMQDIAVSTGATLISEEVGLSLENSDTSALGSAKKVIVTKDDTIIMDGTGEKSSLEERIDQIRGQIETQTSEYEKEKLQERLGRLSGGVAVIKVGGASEVEVGELKDRVNDALCATRAAALEGIVIGGGTALLYASKSLESVKGENFDQNIGIRIVQKACKQPAVTIANNAGYEGSVIVERILEQSDNKKGFDAAVGETTDLIARGVIDPTKVVRTALVDASGVASLMITTEAMVVEVPEPPAAGGAPPAGGMPGMGGMGGMGGGMF